MPTLLYSLIRWKLGLSLASRTKSQKREVNFYKTYYSLTSSTFDKKKKLF